MAISAPQTSGDLKRQLTHQIDIERHAFVVRINGTLPDLSTIGDLSTSERATEANKMEIAANTSCSVFTIEKKASSQSQIFHLLIDIGQGVMSSLEKAGSSFMADSKPSEIPNALLVTHSHDDHISDLLILASKIEPPNNMNVYCTDECRAQILNRFPALRNRSTVSFNSIKPNETCQIGPFSVIPILAYHGENSPPGSVIYIAKIKGQKIIFGWDFATLPNVDESLMWNPELLILGTQSYNPHSEDTGMVSVTDAYQLVRRWNAKECYLVHYRGLMDFQESKNQWFRGPTKAMTSIELQKTVDSHLGISGDNGRFNITVAKEGMIWASQEKIEEQYNENLAIGNVIEVEGIEQYVCRIEKPSKEDKLKLEIEDSINRYTLQFDRPRRDRNDDLLLRASAERGMLARGPELKMELVVQSPDMNNNGYLRINAYKGKKSVFKDDILVHRIDAQKLDHFFRENFSKLK